MFEYKHAVAFNFSEQSVRFERRDHNLSCPKEPATGTQACSPCCTPTWSRRMRHWSARARARHGPLPCSSRNTRAQLSCDPQTSDAKWARGSRSQTHRRAAKGGFTQDDGYVRGLAPTHTILSLFGRFARAAAERPNPILLYNWVLDTDTGTGPIPSITVSGVNAYSGGVLARALPEGLRYLST